MWASLELPTCNEDDCGLFSVSVLCMFGGQRAQSMDSDHSGFVKASANNTGNPKHGPALPRKIQTGR